MASLTHEMVAMIRAKRRDPIPPFQMNVKKMAKVVVVRYMSIPTAHIVSTAELAICGHHETDTYSPEDVDGQHVSPGPHTGDRCVLDHTVDG